MKSILCCGYIALDLISFKSQFTRRAGGTAGNVACNLSFLGWNASVAGVVGQDAAGRVLHQDLRKAGVDVKHLSSRPEAGTPAVVHEVSDRGHRFSFHCPECGRRFPKYRPLDEAAARSLCEEIDVDVFFFDRASIATAILAETLRDKGALVVFEPSTQGREPARCLKAAHVVKYSTERAAAVEPLLSGAHPRLKIVTDGAKGATATLNGRDLVVPALPANLVDAGGAGDWTTAGTLWSLLKSADRWTASTVEDALRAGQALASVSCGYPGARSVTDFLTRDEMLKAARDVIEEHRPPPSEPTLPRRPRPRSSGCAACLSAAQVA